MGASLEVYAINIEQETPSYLKYLREKNYSWINVQDTAHLTKFRDYYDIYSTPVAFVLDKERNIIGKRIDPPALDDFLKEIFRQEGLNVEVNDKNDAVENIKSFSKSSLLKDKQSKSKDEN